MPPLQNPLDVPELLDHTLSFVHSRRDLCASALVNRSWVYSSQSRIFASIEVSRNDSKSDQLLDALETSRHLVDHVLMLTTFERSCTGYLRKLVELQFSRLTALQITAYDQNLSPAKRLDIQALLRIPTLTDVFVYAAFDGWDELSQIWDGCSTNIQHLLFGFGFPNPPLRLTTGSRLPVEIHKRIKLTSFAGYTDYNLLAAWFQDPRCPFDVSGLKAFQLDMYESPSASVAETIAGSLATIEILSLRRFFAPDPVIPHFQRVTQLDIEQRRTIDLLGSIQQLPSALRHRILAIRICGIKSFGYPDRDYLGTLNTQLSEFHEFFPQLQIVMINFRTNPKYPIAHKDTELLRAEARSFTWNVSPQITVLHNFDWENQIPWHASIL